MTMEEYQERITRGKESAQYRRDILNEWADTAEGEIDIPYRMRQRYRNLYESTSSIAELKEVVSFVGSYLLDGQLPPYIRGGSDGKC